MRYAKLCGHFGVLILALTIMPVVYAQGGTYKILHQFAGGADGASPESDLIADSAGNLYGATLEGGTSHGCDKTGGCGIVFELTPAGAGGWKEAILYSFKGFPNAAQPSGKLAFDASGNLYGTTLKGGSINDCPQFGAPGCGTVFKLSPDGSGGWVERVIHNFGAAGDGYGPFSGVVMDANGNLFGLTGSGGDPVCNCGVVFELSPSAGGGWRYAVISAMTSKAHDAITLSVDATGNLFIPTQLGGTYLGGTVLQLAPFGGARWKRKILHSFGQSQDGKKPYAPITSDSAGNLYGTTLEGGTTGNGTVYELSPNGDGTWTETVLYNFVGGQEDGKEPESELVLDSQGNLYGTTHCGGPGNYGTLFKLTRNADGTWTESIVHSFMGVDGYAPFGGMFIDSQGNVFGTTSGSSQGYGIAFEYTP